MLSSVSYKEAGLQEDVTQLSDTVFNSLIDSEKYKDDIEIFKSLYKVSNNISKGCEKLTENYFQGLIDYYCNYDFHYDFSNHCFKVGYKKSYDYNSSEDQNFFVFSFGSESMLIGEQKDEATHRISIDGKIEQLKNSEKSEPLLLFKDITLD